MMNNDFYKLFNSLSVNILNFQKLINPNDKVKAYYGINNEGNFRISFLSSRKPNISNSTKNINIVQGESSKDNYWTCFDLKNKAFLQVFCIFCQDLCSCVINEKNEELALTRLKNRYYTWVNLFKKNSSEASIKTIKGLYGELYFLKNYMIQKYGIESAISSWSGTDNLSKDFSIDETWYEVKTIRPTSNTIRISSVTQLSSDKVGTLAVIFAEDMAKTYNDSDSNVYKLVSGILSEIKDDFLKDDFLNKLMDIGYNNLNEESIACFAVKKMNLYRVDDTFPAIREKDISQKAISNLSYDLILKSIDSYLI